MKLYKSFIGAALALAACGAMSSCDNEFDRPPVIVPLATIEANTAISELKEMYWDVVANNKYETLPVKENGDSIIIGGRIISSDEMGNVYQQIIIEDASGAICLRVRGYDLYQSYQYGQEIRINVTGLIIGGYGQQAQIGVVYNNGVGGMEPTDLALRAQRNGLAEPEKVTVPQLTVAEIAAFGTDKAKRMEWGWRLVEVTDATFDGGGTLAWSDAPTQTGATNRKLTADGKSLDVRTSNKSKFAADILPAGKGNVKCILGYFNASWQLTVMDPATDCTGFTAAEPGTPDTPDTPVTPATTVFSETFETGVPATFTIEDVKSDPNIPAIWTGYAAGKCIKATGFESSTKINYAVDSYLVSPVIDLTDAKTAVLNYEQACNYFTDVAAMKKEATVCARVEGSKEWTTLVTPDYPSSNGWTFVPSGDVDLKAFAGKKIQVALHYVSTDAKAGTWEVKNLTVKK